MVNSSIVAEVVEEMNDLPDNLQQQVLKFVVELRQHHLQAAGNAWDVLESLTGTIEAPTDWSSEHDRYLYGSPKHQEIDS
jgi:hypothetical protein